ncbi:hypothetical protein BGZ81_005694 [Podila clonocystis]|nr:hypothetical protein BGZ81_005694 [Podila clonocystis]
MDVINFVPGRSIVDKNIQALKALMSNSVRLGAHWAGVKPIRGQYNQTHLDISRGIIQKLQENSIYTLVDQTPGYLVRSNMWTWRTIGTAVNTNWLTPDYSIPYPQKAPFAVDANGVPSDADCNSIDWSTSYLDYAVGNVFGSSTPTTTISATPGRNTGKPF